MRNSSRRRLLAPVAAGTLLALCASVALAEGVEDSDSNPPGCAEIGCEDGSRNCGHVEGGFIAYTWILHFVPLPYTIPVSYNCYEKARDA